MGWFNVRKNEYPFEIVGKIMVPNVEYPHSGPFRKWACVMEISLTSTSPYTETGRETFSDSVKEVQFEVLEDGRRPGWREVFVIADDYTLPEWKNMADFQEQTP